jgi:multisubunit Na+/H+ antiporter MnhE subunit
MANQNPGGDAGQHAGWVTGPLAGEPRRRPPPDAGPRPRRVATWLAWWVLMMSLWVAVDDSFESDELLVGAGVAAVAALAAELVTHQAEVRLRVRAAWLVRAFGLPGQVVQQTFLVFAVLAAALFTKAPPPRGRFRELPVRYGDDTPLGVTRRLLLTGARSLAPNEFVLGIDAERDVMITHQLVEER